MDTIPDWWYIIGIPANAGLDVKVSRRPKLQLYIVDSTNT